MTCFKRRPWTIAAGPVVAFLVIVPHLVRNAVQTENPVYPLFTSVFNPGTRDYLGDVNLLYGTGRGVLDLLTAPWNMFVVPMHHFDGMIFGAPFVLAFAPLILLAPRRLGPWLPILSFAAVYYVIWFFLLSQHVRFLLPIMPILATAAAAGAALAWAATGGSRVLRAGLVAVAAILAVNQSMFVGIYSALRLPVVFGLMDVATYLRTPNLTTSFYDSCSYIRDNLGPGERYYANIIFPSYYCPQLPMTYIHFRDEAEWWLRSESPPSMTLSEFIGRAEEENLRFFLVPKGYEFRRNVTGRAETVPLDVATLRFGEFLAPALSRLTPVQEGKYTSVYDGRAVVAELRKLASAGGGGVTAINVCRRSRPASVRERPSTRVRHFRREATSTRPPADRRTPAPDGHIGRRSRRRPG